MRKRCFENRASACDRDKTEYRRFGGILVIVAAMVLSACTAREEALPEMIFPTNESSIALGRVLLEAVQSNQEVADFALRARFEFQSGQDWQPIAQLTSGGDYNRFQTWWETSDAEPGAYRLRVGMALLEGAWVWSEPVAVQLRRAPEAVATSEIVARAGKRTTVKFDASASSDTEDAPLLVSWDFGDGFGGVGLVVEHTYPETTASFPVALSVADRFGGLTNRYYTLRLLPELFFQQRGDPPACVCTGIALRGDDLPAEEAVLGEDAVPGNLTWPPRQNVADGSTLGPLDKNPENPFLAGGVERLSTGYAFEIHATVRGMPAACMESQILKETQTICRVDQTDCAAQMGDYDPATRCCTFGLRWRGLRSDIDGDGTIDLTKGDIDVDTEAKCRAAGGVWEPQDPADPTKGNWCRLHVRKDGSRYVPDALNGQGPNSQYNAPDDYKSHPTTNAIWLDAPAMTAPNGSGSMAEFIAFLRGTDNRYCYVQFEVQTEIRTGRDREDLRELSKQINADKLPGF
jgi:hypothetical protein